MKCLVLLALLGGCASKAERWCDAFVDRWHRCNESGLPLRVRAAVRDHCVAIASYERAPEQRPGNLAEVAKRSLEACSPELACADFHECLEHHRCRLLFAPGEGFQLSCWGP